MAISITSCGSKTPAPATTPAVTTEISEGMEVMEYTYAKPATRAYGSGTHFKEDVARRMAETNARAALAAAIQTMVMQSFDSYAGAVSATGNVDGIDSMLSEDQVSSMNEQVTAISKEVVTNTAVSKIQRYKNGNQYTIYVCVEHNEDVKALVKQVTEKVSSNIPNEIKEEIAYDKYLHEKKMQKAFEEYTATSK